MQLATLLSLILSIFILIIINALKNKRNEKLFNEKNIKNEIEKVAKQLLFSSNKSNLDFFKALFKQKIKIVIYKYKYLWNEEHKILIIPFFNHKNLHLEDLTNLLKEQKPLTKKIYLFCIDADKDTINEAIKILTPKIKIYNINDLYYKFLKPLSIMPDFTIEFNKKEKLNFKLFIDFAFSPQKAKGYFLCGLILFFYSFFMIYNVYYIVFSTLLFVFALFSKFKKQKPISVSEFFDE